MPISFCSDPFVAHFQSSVTIEAKKMMLTEERNYTMAQSRPISHLMLWFEEHRRPFPWRALDDSLSPPPYSVWISEVMLQQTRAEVVIPYFLKWMERYRSIESIANAPLADIFKSWEGLGYYARAKSIWLGAKYLMNHHQGNLPQTYEELRAIPGFGPYTAGAVASFAFHAKAAAVDANVTRVITRLLGITDRVDHPSIQKQIGEQVLSLLPDNRPWLAMEALIELGATLCKKRPHCDLCPLREVCIAHLHNMTDIIPLKKERRKTEVIERDVAIFISQHRFLIGQVVPGKVMAGLYEFPYLPRGQIKEWIREDMTIIEEMKTVTHTFTHFRAILYPYLILCQESFSLPGYRWIAEDMIERLAFSAGHRKILTQVLSSVRLMLL
jgi:A/G-specific adenine glycosylase